jgi:hypothetical protein
LKLQEIFPAKVLFIPNVRKGRKVSGEADVWNDQTVKNILSNQVYCGDTVNFKTEKISFKDQRRINHNPSFLPNVGIFVLFLPYPKHPKPE